MKIHHEDYDQLTVIKIKGDLISDETDRLRRIAVERMDERIRDFVLDLSEMEFVDSKGLETLIWLQDQSADRLGQIRLAACQETVLKILEITRLASRFDCHDEIDAAVKSLR